MRLPSVKNTVINSLKQLDPVLLISSSFLILVSLLMMIGGRENFGNSKVVMQLAMSVVGFVVMVFISTLNYEQWVNKFYFLMIAGSVTLMFSAV